VKVLVAHNRYASAQPSGENSVVDAELHLLAEAGVHVVTYLRSSDEIPTLPPLRRASLPLSPIYAADAQRDLAALLARERPDVVHLHNPYPLLSPWVVRTARRYGVPVVQSVHNFRHSCVSGVFFRNGRPCHDCLNRTFALPAIRHGCYRGSRPQSAVMATALAVHRPTWRLVDRFFALTPAMSGYLGSLGVPDQRVVVKPNSVPDPGRHATVGDGFLFAGRLAPEKGLQLLLDAWVRHPDGALGPLRVAGEGPMREQVAAVAARRSDVELLGRLDPAAVRTAMRRAAAVVVPSTWDEVCPMVAIEALANARPLVVTARGGLPWLVGAGRPEPAGWVTEPEVESLARVLARTRREAPALAPIARARYEAYFSPDVVLATLVDTYRSVAGAER
jgi:glycosyltransferase involved in cell wall biosynthesis